MKKQYLFLILVIYLIGCIMNLCYYIVTKVSHPLKH